MLTGCSGINKSDTVNQQSQIESNTINEEKSYVASTYITDEMKNNSYESGMMLSLGREYTPEYLNELADAIVISTVISLDYADTKIGENNSADFGMTNGTLIIDNTLYGDLEEGSVVNYARPGGTITVEEWEKTQDSEANAKREYLRQENGITNYDKSKEYMTICLEDDIEIEAGKTYLTYLTYNKVMQKYEIIGIGGGLREINMPVQKTVTAAKIDISTAKLKDNKTDEYSSLQEYITKYIPN